MTPERWTWLLNFTGFQLGWFACVLGGAWGLGTTGALVGLLLALLHLAATPHRRPEVILLFAAGLMGAAFDTSLIFSGAAKFSDGGLGSHIAPEWMIVLWMLFAATLNVSLSWLKARIWVAVLAGAISGPLAYLAGERLGAMIVVDRNLMLVWLVVGWGIAVPALASLSNRLCGFGNPALYAPSMCHWP